MAEKSDMLTAPLQLVSARGLKSGWAETLPKEILNKERSTRLMLLFPLMSPGGIVPKSI